MPKSSVSQFFSNVVSSGLGKASTVVFGLLCMLIYARWMSPADYGGFVLLQVMISLGLSFGEFGMDTVTTRFIAGTEDEVERRKIINTGYLFRVLCMAMISLVFFLFQEKLYELLGGKVPQQLLVYLPAFLLTEGLLSFFSYVLQGMLKFKTMAVINFTYGLTSLLLTIILVIPFNMGAYGLVWARLAPKLLCLILVVSAVKMTFKIEFDLEWFKKLFKFGIPLYGNRLLEFAYGRADTLIIGYYFGPSEIAIYEFARRIPESLEMLYIAFVDVYFPYITNLFSSKNLEKISNMVNHANRLTAVLGSLGVILAFGFGKWFFELVFSDQYLASVPPFVILMVALIFIALDSNLGYTLVAIGEPEKPLFINLFRFGIVFACYFVLIPRFQIIGAVVSSLIGLIMVNPVNVFFLRRRSVDVKMIVYVRSLLLLALGLIPYYIYGSNIPVAIIFLVIFIAGCWFSQAIRLEDIQLIQKETGAIVSRIKGRLNHEHV
jgi:O-antigen/teichoic acid export membrane protein